MLRGGTSYETTLRQIDSLISAGNVSLAAERIDSLKTRAASSPSPSSYVVTDTTAFSKAQCLNIGLKFLNQGTEEFNADRYSDSVNSFEQSLYWMSRADELAMSVLCLTQLCFIQEYCGDIAGALSRLEAADALKYSRRMLKMAESMPEVSDVGLEYFNIAEVYQKSGDTVRCFAASDSMSLYDRDMIATSRHLQLRAMMRGRFGKWTEAARLYEAADSILALCGAETWPERMRVRYILAGALYQSGNYTGSLRLYSERFDWCGKVYGEVSDMTIQALCNLANMKAVVGDIEGGSRDYMEVERRLTSRIAERLRFLPGEARGACLSEMLDIAFRMSAFGIKAGHECDAFMESSWDALLMAKGLLLASERGASEIVRRNGTEEDRRLYSEICDLQSRLSELERVGCADASDLTETARQLAVADSRLAAQCAYYGDVGAFLKKDASAVRASLAEGDVIVNITDFNSSDGTHKYCAYVITHDSTYARFVYLCNSSVPDALLEDGSAGVWRRSDLCWLFPS